MLAHMQVRPAGLGRRRAASFPGRFAVSLVLLACGLVLQGCANPPVPPDAGRDAANPQARTPAATYRSATEPYVSRRPIDPKAWREPDAPAPPEKP